MADFAGNSKLASVTGDAAGATVVVPTLNRGTYLVDTVRDLLMQSHRPLEILIVDQSDTESAELNDLINANTEVITYHRVSFRGLPIARNYGWQHARYEAVVFVDDDIRCGTELVTEHLRALSIEGVGIVAGAIDEKNTDYGDPNKPGKFSFWTAIPERGFHSHRACFVDHAPGGNFSCWRAALKAAGGFDEAFGAGAALYEELELCLCAKAAGHRTYFQGSARLLHLAASGGGCRVTDISRYCYWLCYNRAILVSRYLPTIAAPFAAARLAVTLLSFSIRYRKLNVIPLGISGFINGLRAAGSARKCTADFQVAPALAKQ
jgi:glycosyltransferase involved in cell wall biosynthesis